MLIIAQEMTDVILTVNGGLKICQAIQQTKAHIGLESGNKIPETYTPNFVDYPFTKENLGFDHHLKIVKKYRPKYAVAPDLEEKQNKQLRLKQASQLEQHADHVIFITKIGSFKPSNVPSQYVIGIPNQPKFGSNGCWPLSSYVNCKKVHILGGSPLTYPRLKFLNVHSVDSASLVKAAAYGNYYKNEGWQENGDIDYYQRIKYSLNNIYDYWN